MTPPRLHLVCAACALALACAGAPAKDGPAPAAAAAKAALPPAGYLPLAVGNAWTYEARGGGQTSQDTIRIVGTDGPWFIDDHRGRLRLEPDGVRDRDRYLLRAPLEAGRSWTAVEQLVVQRFEVAAVEVSVAVPAGRFEHCLVVRNQQALPGGGRFTTEWTYAPGVGLVALRTRATSGGKEQEQASLQLVRFEPADR